MSTQKAAAELQLDDGQKSSETQEGTGTMTILAPAVEADNTTTADTPQFDTTLAVDARFAGGTITLEPEHVEWLGSDLVKVDMPGHVLHLRPHEARDLAAALQSLAQHIDEEQPRELQRPVLLASAPETEGIGGGL